MDADFSLDKTFGADRGAVVPIRFDLVTGDTGTVACGRGVVDVDILLPRSISIPSVSAV